MAISYKKLFELMDKKGVKKTHLRNIHHINSKVINSLVHDRSITVTSIMQLCEILNCQPGDIIEYVKECANNPIQESCPVPTKQGS